MGSTCIPCEVWPTAGAWWQPGCIDAHDPPLWTCVLALGAGTMARMAYCTLHQLDPHGHSHRLHHVSLSSSRHPVLLCTTTWWQCVLDLHRSYRRLNVKMPGISSEGFLFNVVYESPWLSCYHGVYKEQEYTRENSELIYCRVKLMYNPSWVAGANTLAINMVWPVDTPVEFSRRQRLLGPTPPPEKKSHTL